MNQGIFLSGITKDEVSTLIRAALREELASTLPQPEKPEGYLSREDVCGLFAISYPTLRKHILSGKIKGYRIGRRVLFKENEIKQSITAIR